MTNILAGVAQLRERSVTQKKTKTRRNRILRANWEELRAREKRRGGFCVSFVRIYILFATAVPPGKQIWQTLWQFSAFFSSTSVNWPRRQDSAIRVQARIGWKREALSTGLRASRLDPQAPLKTGSLRPCNNMLVPADDAYAHVMVYWGIGNQPFDQGLQFTRSWHG